MPPSLSSPSPNTSGITTTPSGVRHIPSSTRADGSTRKEIRVRPGYRPPEDVEVYKNRTAEAWKTRGRTGGMVPGAEGLKSNVKASGIRQEGQGGGGGSSAATKNSKRREARRKAKASVDIEGGGDENEDRDANANTNTNTNSDGDTLADAKDEPLQSSTSSQTPPPPSSSSTNAADHPSKTDSTWCAADSAIKNPPSIDREKEVRTLKKKLRQARELREKRVNGESLLPEQVEKVIRISELIRRLDGLGFDAEGEPKRD